MRLADPARLQASANTDPEFRIAARYWNATLSLESPSDALRVEIADGQVTSCRESDRGQSAAITVVASDEGWAEFLAPIPRPFYYGVDHDLTGLAATIGKALADKVPGATFRMMPSLGHFPMSENPTRFREYILPVLDEIRAPTGS